MQSPITCTCTGSCVWPSRLNEPPSGADEVDHINRIKLNNPLDNLRWVTRAQNKANRTLSVQAEARFKLRCRAQHAVAHLKCKSWRGLPELKLRVRSYRGQDPVDELDSDTSAVAKTHPSIAAAAAALKVPASVGYSVLALGGDTVNGANDAVDRVSSRCQCVVDLGHTHLERFCRGRDAGCVFTTIPVSQSSSTTGSRPQ